MPTLPLKDEPAFEGVRDWGEVLRRRRRGNDAEAVTLLQGALNRMGATLTPDGDYGPATKAAVARFQAWAEMEVDGVFGARSLFALSEALDEGLTFDDAPPPPEPVTAAQAMPRLATEAVGGLYPKDVFRGRVALTFDDGPKARTTPKILDTLNAAGAKGCFFIKGNAIRYAPEVLQRILAEGHSLGHHSWDHPKLDTLSPTQLDDQLARSQDALNAALGFEHRMTLVRPPYGRPFFSTAARHRPKVAAAFNRAGLFNIMWHVDTNDWKYRSDPGRIAREADRSLARKHGVVLMHDIHRQTVDALPKLIEKIQARGLAFTTVEALLEEKYGPALTA